jgi:hypothetical protein
MRVKLPKPLHGWRAFVGEVGIIVLGVLIALAFGQLVDAWQWRDKVSHAEAAMRLELAEDDGPQAYGRALIGQCLDMQIARIHDGAGSASADQMRQWTAAYTPPFRTWDSEAWKVVVASDIGSHMGSDRLIAWSAAYRPLPGMTDGNEREAQLVVELRNSVPPAGDLSSSDLRSLRMTAGQLRLANHRFMTGSLLLLGRMRDLGVQVPQPIQRQLIAHARAMYGSCVIVPDLNAEPTAGRLDANLRSAALSAQ